jgi:hypothetical protein
MASPHQEKRASSTCRTWCGSARASNSAARPRYRGRRPPEGRGGDGDRVVPFASEAAMIAVWVPPIAIMGNLISPTRKSFLACATTYRLRCRSWRVERHDQEIDRARADAAAARHGYFRLAHARNERRDIQKLARIFDTSSLGAVVSSVLGRDVQRAAVLPARACRQS